MAEERWNRRREGRIPTRFEALYSAGRMEGAGVLLDISYSGALFGETSLRPELGKTIRAYVFVQPVNPIELVGEVVRLTDNGFAVTYELTDPELRRLVDDAAAVVSAPPRNP
jgi:PilZ domain